MKASGNTILMTGGGSGIGAALAQRLAEAGNEVIVAGRRREALEEVAAGRAGMHVAPFDVDDASSIPAFAERLLAEFPKLNVLVNNAGIMRLEDASTRRDLRDAEETITTNLLGPIRLIDALVDHLAAVGDGVIVNVTSGLAFVPLIDAPTYCATKAAIHSYTVSLRELLRGKVEVLELMPPGVQTTLTPGQATRPGYMPLGEFIEETLGQWMAQPTPEEMPIQRAKFLRTADREGRFDQTLAGLTKSAREARQKQVQD